MNRVIAIWRNTFTYHNVMLGFLEKKIGPLVNPGSEVQALKWLFSHDFESEVAGSSPAVCTNPLNNLLASLKPNQAEQCDHSVTAIYGKNCFEGTLS